MTKRDRTTISSSVLHRAKQGDEEAWTILVDMYSPLVFYWCMQYGVEDSDCPDVCQDILTAIFQKLHQFERNEQNQSFRAWAKTITKNRALDRIRWTNRRIRTKQLDIDPWDDGEEQDGPGENRVEVQMLANRMGEFVLKKFPARYQVIYQRTILGNEPAAGVAKELGLKVGVIYTARSRILSAIREEFGDLEDWSCITNDSR